MSRRTIFIAVGLLPMVVWMLAACAQATPVVVTVEKTKIVTREVIQEGETVIQEVVVTATPEPKEEGPRTLVICLSQEPNTLYPNGASLVTINAVLEAIYDGPIDGRSYSYQPIILEKLPSLADGDAVLTPVVVKVGDRIVGEDGGVCTLESGVIYRPAGCNASDCAVAYDGNSDVEMDQLSATFRMLPGLLWSDGTPLTAADSVYGYNLAADPDTPSVKYLIDRTASYTALDEMTTVWTGLPGFMDSTYSINFSHPFPKHLMDQYTALELLADYDKNQLWLGWGPYIIDEWIKGDRITLHKNPNYFRADEGLPYFDNLVFRFVGADSNATIAALLSGECDIADQTSVPEDQSEVLLELQAARQLQVSFVTGTTWEHVDFNITPLEGAGFAGWDEDGDGQGPFGDVRLRQAIALCMDRQSVVDSVTYGQSFVLDTYLPPEHPLFNPEVKHWDFDVTAGSVLLDEIGWLDEDGDPSTPRVAQDVTGVTDGTRLEFSLGTTSSMLRQQATQILADSLAQCGIKANLEYYPSNEWFAYGPEGRLFGRRTDLSQFAWATYVQPGCELWTTVNIPGDPADINPYTGKPYNYGWLGQNQTGYSNPEYDALCKAAQQALPGQPAYEANHLAAQIIFSEELPVIPLFLRIMVAAARIDMCNFIMDPTSLSEFWNIEKFDYGEGCNQ